MVTDTDWAWAAGFFDGEGHISTRNRTGNGHLPKYRSGRSIVICINQHHREVLDRFYDIVGYGNVTMITKTRPERSALSGTYESFSWRCGKREGVLHAVEHMWPYLGSVKRLQAAGAIILHTRLDPKGQQVVPSYLLDYYQDRSPSDVMATRG